jgi:UDP-N-acetylglucosamine--N-acetylmuramyl-(pentapeptide) pyrophosphoryl-undecaprenol N-acetylglucosamine transferase
VKVLVACAGTGGHIFPALSFLKILESRQKELQVALVLTRRKIEKELLGRQYEIFFISPSAFYCPSFTTPYSYIVGSLKFILRNCLWLINLLRGVLETLGIVLKFKPDIVIGFGGYGSFLPCLLAALFGIKVIIHEQNVFPGLSNRILAALANKIAVSFDRTLEYLARYRDKALVTGNPLRQEVLISLESQATEKKRQALDFFKLSSCSPIILVMGGSLGAHKINQEFIRCISMMEDEERIFQIIHLSGRRDFLFLKDMYNRVGGQVRLFPFLRDMKQAYLCSDLVISRAGANTISEIMFWGLPCIIIPYPYAGGHQLENARFLKAVGASTIIEEKDLSAGLLKRVILDSLTNLSSLKSQAARASRFIKSDAADRLADLVVEVCN